MTFEKGSKGFDMMGEYFHLCKKWSVLPGDKNEETILDRAIDEMVEFCRKYQEDQNRLAINIAAALFLNIDCMVRGADVLGDDKAALRITALWLEKLVKVTGGEQ